MVEVEAFGQQVPGEDIAVEVDLVGEPLEGEGADFLVEGGLGHEGRISDHYFDNFHSYESRTRQNIRCG